MASHNQQPPVELSHVEKQVVVHLTACAEGALGSGSDFNKGVVRGLEIATAQIQHGHHRKHGGDAEQVSA